MHVSVMIYATNKLLSFTGNPTVRVATFQPDNQCPAAFGCTRHFIIFLNARKHAVKGDKKSRSPGDPGNA